MNYKKKKIIMKKLERGKRVWVAIGFAWWQPRRLMVTSWSMDRVSYLNEEDGWQWDFVVVSNN